MKKLDVNGAVLIFLSTLLYGSYGVWSVLLGKDFGIFFQDYVRAIIVLLFLIPICIYTKSWKKIEKENYKNFLAVSLFGSLVQVPLYYAYQNAGIGITNLVSFLFSILASFLFGKLFFGEKMVLRKWIALFFGSLGLFLLFYNSLGSYSLLALIMAGVGGFLFGGETSLSKLISNNFSALQISIVSWVIGIIVCLPLSLIFNEKQIVPRLDFHWVVMFIFAIVGLLSFYLVIEGYKKIDAGTGGLISIFEAVFGVAFGVVLFGEKLTVNIIFGSLLILFAAVLPQIKFHIGDQV